MDGTFTERLGDYYVRVSIEGTTSAGVAWSDAAGRVLKGVPASIKEHYGAKRKELQKSVKEMEKMLVAHKARIERLLLTQRTLSIQTLTTCYLEQPLLADMARRLIWQVDSGLGIWHEGRMIDDAERPIDLNAQTTARLWHPASSNMETILHWRCWLEDHGIREPFKQAHREVYLIYRCRATDQNLFQPFRRACPAATHVRRPLRGARLDISRDGPVGLAQYAHVGAARVRPEGPI